MTALHHQRTGAGGLAVELESFGRMGQSFRLIERPCLLVGDIIKIGEGRIFGLPDGSRALLTGGRLGTRREKGFIPLAREVLHAGTAKL